VLGEDVRQWVGRYLVSGWDLAVADGVELGGFDVLYGFFGRLEADGALFVLVIFLLGLLRLQHFDISQMLSVVLQILPVCGLSLLAFEDFRLSHSGR